MLPLNWAQLPTCFLSKGDQPADPRAGGSREDLKEKVGKARFYL
jgi:hypothetical protein